jgi:hypothetical protein
MNRWGIPNWLEAEIRARDTVCVYCGIQLVETAGPNGSRTNLATWEHIVNDASIVTRENIARCCNSCNASKGSKNLNAWLSSSYCKKKRIDGTSVADVVKNHLLASERSGNDFKGLDNLAGTDHSLS